VQLGKLERRFQHGGSVTAEDLEPIVDLESLVQDRGEYVAPAGRPVDLRRAGVLALSDLLLTDRAVGLDVPEVHLALGDVSKPSNDQHV